MNEGEDLKRCCKCIKKCLKINFYKNKNRKVGVNSMCKIFMNNFLKKQIKKMIKTDVGFRLIRNTKRRIHHALNGKTISSSTLDI